MAIVLLRGGNIRTPDIQVSVINGQLVPTYEDTGRSKQLSVSDHSLIWSRKMLQDLTWLSIGDAVDADSGYTADLDGTIVSVAGQCEETSGNTKDIHIFVNGTDNGSTGTLGPGTNVSFINNTIDIDFSRGDLIRLRGVGSGQIQDTVVKVVVKWRA